MEDMDYSKLRGRTRELGFTQKEVAQAANMSESTYSLKLCNRFPFKQREIADIVRFLEIEPEEISLYFFTPKV